MYADALGLLAFGASLTSGSLSKEIFDRLKVTVGIAYRDFLMVSYQYSVAMVNFVLDDLGRPAGKGFDAGLELLVLPFDFNRLITLAGTRTAKKGQATLLGFVWPGHFDDFRIEHNHIGSCVIKGDDPPEHPNHIGSHTHTAFPVGGEGVQQVVGYLEVLGCCRLGSSGQ